MSADRKALILAALGLLGFPVFARQDKRRQRAETATRVRRAIEGFAKDPDQPDKTP